MFKTLLLTKTLVHARRGAQPLLHALFDVKSLSATLLRPAFNETGCGTRWERPNWERPSGESSGAANRRARAWVGRTLCPGPLRFCPYTGPEDTVSGTGLDAYDVPAAPIFFTASPSPATHAVFYC